MQLRLQKIETKNTGHITMITEGQMIKAVDTIIGKRKAFLFILRPFRKVLPDCLLVEIPLGFLDRRIQYLDFLDRLLRK